MFSIQTRTTAAFILLIYIKAASVPVFTHDVEIPPSFLTMPPREIIHIPGRPLHIPCKAIGFPEPRYEWYNNGQLLSIGTYADANFYAPKPETKNYFKLTSEGSKTLLWDFSSQLNSGRLKPGWINCVATNPKGKALTPPTRLRIAELSDSGFCEPQTLMHVNERFFILNCSVPRSTPPAKIRWMFRREDGHIGFISENRTFSMDDSGNLYVSANGLPSKSVLTVFCSASNELLRTMRTGCDFTLQSKTTFTALPSPILMYKSESKRVALFNSTIEFRCLISARRDTTIVWSWRSDIYSSLFIHDDGAWISKDGKPLASRVEIQLRAERTILFIPRVTFDHSGTFTCRLHSSTSFSTEPISADFKLLVESEPFFGEKPTDLTVPIGGSGQLHCSPNSLVLPKPDVTWYANGDRIEKFLDGKRKRLSGNTLEFSYLTLRDTAVFQCNISNKNGFAFANAYLNVWDSPPAIVDGPPERAVCVEKQVLVLRCRTMGAPSAVVIWNKDDNLQLKSNGNGTDQNSSRLTVQTDGSLLISSLELSDSGTYTCVASNTFGQTAASGKVLVRRRSRVTEGPVISDAKSQPKARRIKRMNTIWVEAGSAVSLSCRGETDVMEVDSLKIRWTRERMSAECLATLRLQPEMLYDEQLCKTYDPPVEISETSSQKLDQRTMETSIALKNLRPYDTGHYRCTVFTRLDNDSAVLAVIVQGPPEPPTAIKLDCMHEVSTQTALMLWEPGSDNNAPITDISLEYIYGSYRPLYVNQWETPDVAAAKIINDLHSALLSNDWQPVKHVLVNVEQEFSTFSSGQALVNLTAHMATLSLYADVAYQFRLSLINSVGRSGPSSVVPGFENDMWIKCIFPPQPPSTQPEDVVIYGNRPNNLIISWETIPPPRHNGPGLQYHLALRCLDCDYEFPAYSKTDNVTLNWNESKIIFSTDTTSQQAAVHRLYPIEIFKKYEIQITTSNLMGFSKAPPIILRGWSGESQPIPAPKNLRVANTEAATVDVVWDWPSVDNIAEQINGFFIGFRISWCPADKSPAICERYKVTQDVICTHPTVELFPEMRVSSANTDKSMKVEVGGWSKTTGTVQSPHTTSVRLSNNPFYRIRSATVTDLPSDTNIRLWICLLNIQYSGPKSEVIYFRTKEGVPGPVSEFIHAFSGVNYVEVTWSKPTQINGNLTGYIIEVIAGDPKKLRASENGFRENWDTSPYYQIEINDPDQMATRLSGLEIDSAYKLIIRAKTASGAGKPRELFVHTAKLRSTKLPAEFTVSPIHGSATTLNVSLVLSNTKAINDDSRALKNGSEQVPASSLHSLILNSTYPASLLVSSTGSLNNKEKAARPNRKEQNRASTLRSIEAFAVQFKRPADETWEETEREYEKSWMVVRNLIPGQEYDMRIILAKTPALSFVSPVRILRVPKLDEIGLGHFSTGPRLQSELQGGAASVSEDTFSHLKSLIGSSTSLQVLLPLISFLCLLLLTTAGVCCWRNCRPQPLEARSQGRRMLSRQTVFPVVDVHSPARLSTISFREMHVERRRYKGSLGRKEKDVRITDFSKSPMKSYNFSKDRHNLPTALDSPKKAYSSSNEKARSCAQLQSIHPSASLRPISTNEHSECIQKETVF
ncbi:hypothetical protein AAHC03_01597 [Spirometra sp. Aus1]